MMAWITSAPGRMMSARSLRRPASFVRLASGRLRKRPLLSSEGAGVKGSHGGWRADSSGARPPCAPGCEWCRPARPIGRVTSGSHSNWSRWRSISARRALNSPSVAGSRRMKRSVSARAPRGADWPRTIAPVAHQADLRTAAADIDHGAVGERHVVERADRAIIGLALAVQDAQGEAQFTLDAVEEEAAIGGVAHGAGGRGDDFVGADAVAEALEEAQGDEGALHGGLGQSVFGHALAQAHHLADFVFQAERIAGERVHDDQPRRVGAEIDDGNTFGIGHGRLASEVREDDKKSFSLVVIIVLHIALRFQAKWKLGLAQLYYRYCVYKGNSHRLRRLHGVPLRIHGVARRLHRRNAVWPR